MHSIGWSLHNGGGDRMKDAEDLDVCGEEWALNFDSCDVIGSPMIEVKSDWYS